MAKTYFSSGEVVTPSFLNAINSPVFDDQDLDGHNPRLGNNALAKGQGTIWSDFYSFLSELQVSLNQSPVASSVSALLNIAQGWIVDPNGQGLGQALLIFVPASSVVIQNNQTSYVWITKLGTIASGSALPIADPYLPLASVQMAGGVVGNIQDLRPRSKQTLVYPSQSGASTSQSLASWLSPNGSAYSIAKKIRTAIAGSPDLSFLWASFIVLLGNSDTQPSDLSAYAQAILDETQSVLTLNETVLMSQYIVPNGLSL